MKWTEDNFKQLVKNSFDMIVLLNEKGVQQYVSHSCEKILGFKPKELTGIDVIKLMIHPDDKKEVRRAFREVLQNKAHGGVQYRHKHKNGHWVYLEAYGTNQTHNPSIGSVILNVRNITERKKTEDQLRESQEHLRRLNATKDKFFSIIAHDLKSPFNSIIGFSNLLLDRVKDTNEPEIFKYASLIRESSIQSMDLLTNLLKWSQSQTGSINFDPGYLNLHTMAEKIISFFIPVANQKKIAIRHEIPENYSLYADYELIHTILRNLISNSIKFTHPQGEVVLEVKKEYDTSKISVSDNGVGIENTVLQRLFRIDKHFSTHGTRNEKGSGLGLLLCKDFVEMHKGKIQCKSKPGKGSIFFFTIPHSLSSSINE